ncbi:unnamed protein product [Nyctereutes procyonoides]|uniref:(raccoon dog) hypothetical protein n=1 Tax=Nyctereutes procyonoides TaxID=34880 RepID=A0A811YK13_NYCPR|nr:unnamed protein product [Nyctereutes procyonoides]
MATHDYYTTWVPLPVIASAEVQSISGKPSHHPGLPRTDCDLSHWWANFFFGKSVLSVLFTVLEFPECLESPQASSSTITCDLTLEAA